MSFQSAINAGVAGGGVSSVTTGTVTGAANMLYLVGIGRRKGDDGDVSTVTDSLGELTFTKQKLQCAGRNQVDVEVWQAAGSPSGDFTVTVNLDTPTSETVAVIVARYDLDDSGTPTEDPTGENTVGENDVTCTGGTDSATTTLTLTSSQTNGIHAVFTNSRTDAIQTPDANYTLRQTADFGALGEHVILYLHDRTFTGSSTCTHTLNSTEDWCTAGVVVRPASATRRPLKPIFMNRLSPACMGVAASLNWIINRRNKHMDTAAIQ